jgi:thiamine-phosphate diphosphorylase
MQRSAARILDANLNRAREAMRVLEDFARFALDDAAMSRTLKQMRHDLAAAANVWPIAELLAARNTPGDVGTRITTDGEKRRESVADIVTAAAKRLTEALRVLEEYAKLENPKAAAAIERIRYRAYNVEKRLVPIARDRAPDPESRIQNPKWRTQAFANVRLYVLITESLCRRSWLRTAREAIAGGADCLQLREKDLDDGELLSRARLLAGLCHRHGVLCIINDRPDIARLAGADGVHLGQTDMSVAAAREIAGPDMLIGKSTHNVSQLRRALRERPDYLAIGPMYDTATKPQRHIAGPGTLRKAMRLAQLSARNAPSFGTANRQVSPPPEGRPSSAPEGRPSSAPESRPSSAPEGQPSSAPEGQPSSAPEGRQFVAQGVSPGWLAHAASKPRRGDRNIAPGATGRLSASASPPIPIVAIGGITIESLAPILAAGCRTIAVCAAVIGVDDPRGAADELKRKLTRQAGTKRR